MEEVIEALGQLNSSARAAAEAQIPGLPPPPGQIPNFINPPSQAHWVYVTLPLCLAVSTPFVWIRLYTASFILKNRGWSECNTYQECQGRQRLKTCQMPRSQHGCS